MLGQADLIEGCIANGSPRFAIGRPLKVGKEELFAILAAVEWPLAEDEPATIAAYEARVAMWIEGVSGLSGVRVERGFPGEAGQPHARAVVTLDDDAPVTAVPCS